MKIRRPAIALICVAVALVGALVWYVARVEITDRQLAKEAVACRMRAEHGDAECQFRLGSMYYQGQGIAQDYAKAAVWYRKSADQGNARAEDGLGFMYFKGEAVRQDFAQASSWYRKSAEQGYAKGEYDLGYMSYYGYGMPQDRHEANRLFREAADKGDARAQRFLRWERGYFPHVRQWVLWLKFLAAAYFGSEFLKLTGGRRTRAQIIIGVTVLLLIASLSIDLLRYLYGGRVESTTTVAALYVLGQLLDGSVIAMLLAIVLPRRTRAVLMAAAASFAVLILLQVIYSELRNAPINIRLLCFAGLPAGMAIPPAIFVWIERKKNRRELPPVVG